MEDLQIVEHVARVDPKVIEQCVLSGIPKEDMHKVYCDRKIPRRIKSSIMGWLMRSRSLDNWIRCEIWQQSPLATSVNVLPTPRG